jgi:hypothetical protein
MCLTSPAWRDHAPRGNTGDPTAIIPGFFPDLRKRENRITIAVLVKL